MMHLDHINLCASTVAGLTRTLEQHFDNKVMQAG